MQTVLEQGLGMDKVDADFAPTTRTLHASSTASRSLLGSKHALTATCLAVLTLGPALQSTSTYAPRHKEIVQLLINSRTNADETNIPHFLSTLLCLLHHVEFQDVSLGSTDFTALSDIILGILKKYDFSHDELALKIAVKFIHSTIHVWSKSDAGNVKEKAKVLRDGMADSLAAGIVSSWQVRDSLAQFFSKWLEVDPSCQSSAEWQALQATDTGDVDMDENEAEQGPVAFVLDSLVDEEMRVRFRSATLVTELFAGSRQGHYTGATVYSLAKTKLDRYTNSLKKCARILVSVYQSDQYTASTL